MKTSHNFSKSILFLSALSFSAMSVSCGKEHTDQSAETTARVGLTQNERNAGGVGIKGNKVFGDFTEPMRSLCLKFSASDGKQVCCATASNGVSTWELSFFRSLVRAEISGAKSEESCQSLQSDFSQQQNSAAQRAVQQIQQQPYNSGSAADENKSWPTHEEFQKIIRHLSVIEKAAESALNFAKMRATRELEDASHGIFSIAKSSRLRIESHLNSNKTLGGFCLPWSLMPGYLSVFRAQAARISLPEHRERQIDEAFYEIRPITRRMCD
jgi:hypothetical protein